MKLIAGLSVWWELMDRKRKPASEPPPQEKENNLSLSKCFEINCRFIRVVGADGPETEASRIPKERPFSLSPRGGGEGHSSNLLCDRIKRSLTHRQYALVEQIFKMKKGEHNKNEER